MRRSRQHIVERLRLRLSRDGWPRLQMSFMVAITAGAGFLASWIFLHAGLRSMPARYALATAVAYGVFLMLLWFWLRTRGSDWLDAHDPGIPTGGRSKNDPQDAGDTSSSYDVHDVSLPDVGRGGSGGGGSGGGTFDSLDFGDADAFTIPIVVIVIVAAIVVSSFMVVWSAPVLFAELLVDGILAAGLYRRLKHIETSHWLTTAIKRTFWPFAATAAIAATVGWAVQSAQPRAVTVGEIVTETR